MIRKIVKNDYQYKLNIPISLVRKLGLDDSKVRIKEVKTSEGDGFVVLKDKEEVLEL